MQEEYYFGETVDFFARKALDPIRYGEVESKNIEKVMERNRMREELLAQLDPEPQDLVEDYFEKEQDLFHMYDGDSDSGPSAFLLFVDDESDTVVEDEEYAVRLNSPSWSKYDWSDDGVPEIREEDLAQITHDVMNDNDGAIVVGNDGIYEDTVKILDSDLPRDKYPDVGGTKHEAAVDAVYNDLINQECEEVYREALILSGQTGYVRHFRPVDLDNNGDYEITEFPYDRDANEHIYEGWWQPPEWLQDFEAQQSDHAQL